MNTKENFLENLRDALNYLYDPNRLRRSPLVAMLGLSSEFDPASALQRALTEGIASLEPDASVPSQSRAWRIYDLLFCRYVQQLGTKVVADQLGIGVRHLRREQRAALEALACRLHKQFSMEFSTYQNSHTTTSQVKTTSPTVYEELAWLKDSTLDQPTNFEEILSSVLELVQPLVKKSKTTLNITADDKLPDLAVHPVALNQMLVNLLSAGIAWATSGKVVISARARSWEVEIQIQGTTFFSNPPPLSEDSATGLEMVQQLVELCGGDFHYTMEDRTLTVVLHLPAFERLPVLVIDDNADTLQLLKHYTTGTRYHLFGTTDPEAALRLAEKKLPQIIVLDVMMPQVDGWKILGRLQQHPQTKDVPIIVCTILTQETLALSLGASGFVRKPVTRQDFLKALDHQAQAIRPAMGKEFRS